MTSRRILFAVALALLFTINALSQRDFLTSEEIEIVRDSQAIDSRMNVLTHAIDRRFGALRLDVQAPPFKEKGDWGPAPAGSKLELFLDIKRILQKAIDDIDGLSERPNAFIDDERNEGKKNRTYSDLFPKAVRTLAAAAQRYQTVLATELDKAQLPAEKGAILDSLEMCGEIVASLSKLPAQTSDPKKGKD